MSLAIFDLDNTLIAGDSDYEWGQHLVELGVVEGKVYADANQRFYDAYKAGTLDILEFCRFAFRPLATHSIAKLREWREDFITNRIRPLILPAARSLLARHREAGDSLIIVTATNSFITRPIADELGVERLIATEPEWREGRFTGEPAGIPCFREGKVKRLEAWLAESGESLTGSWFYSDSHNDLPLLELVDHPVAVDADVPLTAHAEQKGWPVISLRFSD